MWRWWARRLWFTLRFTVCFAERGAGAQEKLFWGALCCMRHELSEGGSLQTSMWYDRSMAASQQDLHARPQVTKCTPCADVESSRGTRFVGEGWGSGRRLGHWPRFCGECVVWKVTSLRVPLCLDTCLSAVLEGLVQDSNIVLLCLFS